VKKRPTLASSLIFFPMLVFIFYSMAQAKEYTFTLHKELPAGTSPSLKIQNISGEIRIESHPENKIIIDALKIVEADDSEKAKRVADEIEVAIESHDDQVEIKTRYPYKRSKGFWKGLFGFDWKKSGYVDYHVLVPERIELDLSCTSGDVMVSDVWGKTKVDATSGDLLIKRVKGDLDLQTTSGDVEIFKAEGEVRVCVTSSDLKIFDITGDVSINSVSGIISVEDVVGSIRIANVSGDISLKQIQRNIEASSSSGDLIIDQVEGGLDLETSSGDIQVRTKILPPYEYYAETSSGEIDFSLPYNSDALIKLKTSSGSINCELPVTLHTISRNLLKGKLGAGGTELFLVTSSGDIKLRQDKR